jgi:hypothetical protein
MGSGRFIASWAFHKLKPVAQVAPPHKHSIPCFDPLLRIEFKGSALVVSFDALEGLHKWWLYSKLYK